MAKLWLCFLLLLAAVLCAAQDIDRQLDPVSQSETKDYAPEGDGDRGDRDKRFGIIKKIGLKAGLLDFVFGKIDSFIDSKTRYINELDKQNIYKNEKYFGITYPPKTQPENNLKPTTKGPPPVEFEVNAPVSLVIPDRLYGNSFTLVTNASRILGDVIYNTADRAQEFADAVNTKLKSKFTFAKKVIKFAQPILNAKGYGSQWSSSSGGSSSSSSSSSSSGGTSINLLTKREANSSER